MFFLFLLSTLTVYRLSLMGSSEEGPAAIFARLRRQVPPKTNPGRGIRCIMCWTAWVAGATTAYLYWRGQIMGWEQPLWRMGLSGGAVVVHLLTKD